VEPGKRVQIELRDVEDGELVRPTNGTTFKYSDEDLMVVFMTQGEYDDWVRWRDARGGK
jgi:hypothetical protein